MKKIKSGSQLEKNIEMLREQMHVFGTGNIKSREALRISRKLDALILEAMK